LWINQGTVMPGSRCWCIVPGVPRLERQFLCTGAGSTLSGQDRPPAPCLAQVCCSVSVPCTIWRVAISIASAHLEMRLEANREGAAPDEAAASCSPKKAQTGQARACRPTPRRRQPAPWLGLASSPVALHRRIHGSFFFISFFFYKI